MQLGNIIIVKKNGNDGKKFPLFDHSEYKIGSDLNCHIRIAALDIKDQHICTIRKNKNGKVSIKNLLFNTFFFNLRLKKILTNSTQKFLGLLKIIVFQKISRIYYVW